MARPSVPLGSGLADERRGVLDQMALSQQPRQRPLRLSATGEDGGAQARLGAMVATSKPLLAQHMVNPPRDGGRGIDELDGPGRQPLEMAQQQG